MAVSAEFKCQVQSSASPEASEIDRAAKVQKFMVKGREVHLLNFSHGNAIGLVAMQSSSYS